VEILPVEFEPAPAEEPQPLEAEPPPYDAVPLPEPATDAEPVQGTGMTLEQLESIALANNPAIKELAATTQKAAGYRTQVGAKPNPSVGYQAQQLADEGTDQHLAIYEREFVTGGKLQLNRRVLNAALAAQLQELEAQRLRVTTDIRIRFYQALALQRQLELIKEFSTVAKKGLRIAELREEGGEGSHIDVLQAKIQSNEITLLQQQTNAKLAAVWREISALAGVPHLAYATLEGTLPTKTPGRDWEQLASTLVASSPEYAAAQVRITRACADLERQLKQPLPNVVTQFGAGFDNSTDSGMLNLQFGVPLPINNNNRGNISAARAEVTRARLDAQRIQNNIEARLAIVSREYDTAVAAVNQYASNIIPSAVSSMELAEQAYQAGEVEFVQLLIARRTYFESNLEYVVAQSQLAAAQAKIDGFVLTGALDSIRDESGSDSLRGATFSQQ
jgi:cobalt-zinc-cadmium efflux system outer membrane protein